MAMEPNQVGKLEIPVEFTTDKATGAAFRRQVEADAKQVGKRQAEVQATEFVKQLEREYQRKLGEAREELYRGLIDEKELARRARAAAQEMNRAIIQELERRGSAGRLGRAYTDDFNALTSAFKDVGSEGRRGSAGVGEMRESFASLMAQMVGVHPVFGRILNVIGGLAVGSVVMGAALAGLSALAWAWTKVREEAKEAEEEQRSAIDRLRDLRREQELGPRGQTGADIETARSRQQEILTQQARLEEAFRKGRSLSDPTARVAILQREYDDLEDLIQRAERKLGETTVDEQRAAERRVANLREEIRRQREAEARDTERQREREAQEAQRAADRIDGLEADLQKRLAALTATATDDLLLALDKLEAEAREAAALAGQEVSQAFLDGLALLREDVAASGRLEGFQDRLAEIMRMDRGDPQQEALQGIVTELRREAQTLREGSRARKEYLDLANRAAEAHEKNAKAIERETEAEEKRASAESRAAREQELRDLRDRARLIEENARAGVQLANAIGLVDDEAARTLETLAQLGTSLFRVFNGEIEALPLALGAAAQLLKGLFGSGRQESPAARALREALEANRRAIERNTEALEGRLASGDSTVGGVRAALRTAADAFRDSPTDSEGRPTFSAGDFFALLDQQLAELGLTRQDVEALADQFGIELVGIQGYLDLLEKLGDVSTADIAKSFAGSLELLRREFELMEVSDPAERFRRIREELSRFVSEDLAEQIAALDFSDPQALQEFVAGIMAAIRDGTFDLSLLGRVSLDEFLDAMQNLAGLARSGAPGGTTQDFVQARSITTIQASRIEGGIYSLEALTAMANDQRAAMLAALNRLAGTGLDPLSGVSPASFTPTIQPGGTSVRLHFDALIGEIHAAGADGEGIIEDVTRQVASQLVAVKTELASAINRELGRAYRQRSRTLGRS